jgi:hypothetical protein
MAKWAGGLEEMEHEGEQNLMRVEDLHLRDPRKIAVFVESKTTPV